MELLKIREQSTLKQNQFMLVKSAFLMSNWGLNGPYILKYFAGFNKKVEFPGIFWKLLTEL